jgi:hypothetical protein
MRKTLLFASHRNHCVISPRIIYGARRPSAEKPTGQGIKAKQSYYLDRHEKLPQCIYDKYRASSTALTAWFKRPEAIAAGVETFSTPANRPVVLFF